MPEHLYTFNSATAISAKRGIRVTAPREAWDDFFTALKEFCNENGFQHHIRRIKDDVDLFIIDFWREDVAANGANYNRVEDFDLSFDFDPTTGGSVEEVEQLTAILRAKLTAVQRVSVSARSESK